MNRFVKMERQISVLTGGQVKVDHIQRWSRIFWSKGTEKNLSIGLATEICGIFGTRDRKHPTLPQWFVCFQGILNFFSSAVYKVRNSYCLLHVIWFYTLLLLNVATLLMAYLEN